MLAHVAAATSAAPTYFPPAEIGDELFADGGLFANSPDIIALHEAEHFFRVPIEDVRMLSIGTATAQFSFSHASARRLGVLNWVRGRRLAQTILCSQQLAASDLVGHRLGERYLRIDAFQSQEQVRDLGFDVATKDAQMTIRALATGSYKKKSNHSMLRTILSHRPPKPTFYHRTGGRGAMEGSA